MDKKKQDNKDKLIQPINMSFSTALTKIINTKVIKKTKENKEKGTPKT